MKTIFGTPSRIFSALAAVALLSGCAAGGNTGQPTQAYQSRDADIVANSHQAAERLLGSALQTLDKDKPILVASLVNVANMSQSSNLGRIISEQITTRLAQLGYQTREMKFRGSFLIRKGSGEFVLSRSIREISRKQDAQAVIAGVYAVAADVVYVTVRLIRAEDSSVISSYDYKLPLGPNTLALVDPFESQQF